MSRRGDVRFFEMCIGSISAAFPHVDCSQKDFIFAEIQITAGAGLAAYTFINPHFKFLPYMLSATALGGSYIALKPRERYSRETVCFENPRAWSSCYFSIGILAFTTGVYSFSESLTNNDRMWIPCLPLAASGFYFAATSVSTLDKFVNRRPFLKCCQLMFEPALVACASAYLFRFRGHNQAWLKWLPFLVIGNTGLIIAGRGCRRDGITGGLKHLKLKVIEMFIGSCHLVISGTALAIYSSPYAFFRPVTSLLGFEVTFVGMLGLYVSLACFQRCVKMEAPVFVSICGMISGPIISLSACIILKCIGQHLAMLPVFVIMVGTGLALLGKSVKTLHNYVTRRVFKIYCQRIFGPMMIVYGSVFTVYNAYNAGWRYSSLMVPFIPAGIYTTYLGFRRRNRRQWH